MIEVTDNAIQKLIEKEVQYIRLGVTGGGCAGYEYFIEHAETI
jgi:Fe-S cluster assembly iron-binding protein IscA